MRVCGVALWSIAVGMCGFLTIYIRVKIYYRHGDWFYNPSKRVYITFGHKLS